MTSDSDNLEIVGDFLIRFYHEEPDDVRASTKAIQAMTGNHQAQWQLRAALVFLLGERYPVGMLRDIVRLKANRHAQNEGDARAFLERTFQNLGLDAAINFDDYES
jgi:hypothetical protein